MQSFGTKEYGNKDGFKIMCCNCGKDVRIVPTHYYEGIKMKNISAIWLS